MGLLNKIECLHVSVWYGLLVVVTCGFVDLQLRAYVFHNCHIIILDMLFIYMNIEQHACVTRMLS